MHQNTVMGVVIIVKCFVSVCLLLFVMSVFSSCDKLEGKTDILTNEKIQVVMNDEDLFVNLSDITTNESIYKSTDWSDDINGKQMPGALHLSALADNDEQNLIAFPDDVTLQDFETIKLPKDDNDLLVDFMGTKQDQEKIKLITYNKSYKFFANDPEDDSQSIISRRKRIDVEYFYVVEKNYDFYAHTNGAPRVRNSFNKVDNTYVKFSTKKGTVVVEFLELESQSNGFGGDAMERLGGVGLSQGGSVYYFSKAYKDVYFVKIFFSFPCAKDFEADFELIT